MKHSVSRTCHRRQQQYYSENNSSAFFLCVYIHVLQIFPHCDIDMLGCVWMSRFRRAWTSLNFYKEDLFGFETLVFDS